MNTFGQLTTGGNGPEKPPALLKKHTNGSYSLQVNGVDVLIRGGELSPSSMTSTRYMARIIDDVVASGINTIFGVISWKNIEPIEGTFDFTELDGAVTLCREKGLYLVIQWQGSLVGHSTGNLSDSTPSWVKTNTRRFSRVKRREEVYDAKEDQVIGYATRTTEAVSLFGDEIADVEKLAFRTLARHVQAANQVQSTVIMIQIGSMIGLKRESRDHSEAANDSFNGPVPDAVVHHYQSRGSAIDPLTIQHGWESFGRESGEAETLFSAYHFATYVEALAAIFKRECGLTVFVDVAVNRQGPALHGSAEGEMIAFWKFFTPSLSFFAARLLPGASSKGLSEFVARTDQPLLVLGQNSTDIEKIWPKFGNENAFGVVVSRVDNAGMAASDVPKHFRLLRDLTPAILTARKNAKRTMGFALSAVSRVGLDCISSTNTTIGGLKIICGLLDNLSHRKGGWGIMVEGEEGTLLVAGQGYEIKATSLSPKAAMTRVLDFIKKEVEGEGVGSLQTLRRFTAVETNGGRVAQMFAHTPMIAEVTFYSLEG